MGNGYEGKINKKVSYWGSRGSVCWDLCELYRAPLGAVCQDRDWGTCSLPSGPGCLHFWATLACRLSGLSSEPSPRQEEGEQSCLCFQPVSSVSPLCSADQRGAEGTLKPRAAVGPAGPVPPCIFHSGPMLCLFQQTFIEHHCTPRFRHQDTESSKSVSYLLPLRLKAVWCREHNILAILWAPKQICWLTN